MGNEDKLEKVLELVERVNGNNNQLDKKLDSIIVHLGNLENDVKELSADVKNLNSRFADISREVGSLNTDIINGKEERKEVREELQRLWSHFPSQKEEIKADLKEFAKTIISGQVSDVKAWVLQGRNTAIGSAVVAGVSIVIAVVSALMRK